MANVRYMVSDTESAVAFYTEHLGFVLKKNFGHFAMVALGDLTLWLSDRAVGIASSSRSMTWSPLSRDLQGPEFSSATRLSAALVVSRSSLSRTRFPWTQN